MQNIGFPEYAEDKLPTLFAKAQAESLTTFHMPLWTCDLSEQHDTLSYGDLLDFAPFSRFSVSEVRRYSQEIITSELSNKNSPILGLIRKDGYFYVRETTSLVIEKEDVGKFHSLVYIFARLSLDDGSVIYSPSTAGTGRSLYRSPETLLDVMYRLNDVFKDRQHRFLNQPTSRQVRRSENRPPEYREYIVIPREDVRYKEAISRTEMLKSIRTAHVVRSHDREEHLRQYKDGRIVVVSGSKVREHARGKGLFQVKDYKIK